MINTNSAGGGQTRRPVNNIRGSNRVSPNNRVSMGNNIGRQRNHDVEIDGVYKNLPMTYHLSTLVGSTVRVQVITGKRYEGILKTFSAELELALVCAHLLNPDTENLLPTKDQIIQTLIVNFNDLVTLIAVDADTKYGETDSFTDTAISKAQLNGSVKDEDLKQLTPWDDGGAGGTHLDESSAAGGGWAPEEMFRKNEEQFGVKSSFDDSMEQYTTKLEKSDTPEFYKKRAEAERLASEIESSVTSRRNTSLENGDGLDEETRYSAVIRPSAATTGHLGGASNTSRSNKYTTPHRRDLSQSARLNGREGGLRREPVDKRSKPPPPQCPTDDFQRLKTWKNNFNLTSVSPSQGATGSKSPKSDSKPSASAEMVLSPKAATTHSLSAKSSQQTPPPVVEAPMTKSEVAPVAAALPSPAASSGSGISEKGAAKPLSNEESNVVASPPETKPEEAAVAIGSQLNPNAKEFVYNPKTPSPLMAEAASQLPKQAPPLQPPLQPQHGHPGHQQPQQQYHKSKTATVSVVDAARQPPRADMPTPAQAMGQPLINPNHHGQAPQQFHNPHQFVMVQQPPPRLQRVPSYSSGDGPAGQPHLFQPQQHYIPSGHPYVHNGHVGIPQPIPGHQQMNMAAGPPHNAQLLHQVPPPQQSQTAHHQQQAPPPHSTAAAMSSGNPTPANGQHIHPQNPAYPHHGVPYAYPMVPQQGGASSQPSQPPLQPSPHNPSPSPVTMNNGGPGAAQYHGYPPPQSQQFYQSQGAAAQAVAVSQAAAAGYQQQFIYVPQMSTQYPQHQQMPVYHYAPMPPGYPSHFQPPPPQ